ncbi:MAG: DNA cytosine methyltransferase, partial [Hymenobacter sp.]
HTDRVASTVTTASGHLGSDVNIHPTQNRILSPRECAELQTFPADFNWGPLLVRKALGKIREMIGEAVPPLFTGAHGRVLVELLRGSVNYEDLMPTTDLRARTAMAKFLMEPAPQLALDLSQPAVAVDACTV